ncbi:hypothetical protein, partial [Vibrio vulnificus]|uniref:hypothetical protein n=1 Tax=Vibrio vulnificus TaxID=672 RepID=UPI0039B3CE5A
DPAFKDRFGFVKYFNSELSVLEEILTHIHGASRETVDKLKHFFTVTNNPGMQSKLALAPSVRAIDRIYTEFGGNWRGALLAQRDKWVHLI